MVRKTKAEAERTRQQIIDAARRVFHERGVSRTSFEKVAEAAGVTRGAVYWHFADKAALFFAMRESALTVVDDADAVLLSPEIADPLDAIERSMLRFFETLSTNPEVCEIYEIMLLRCEYVDEFETVRIEINKPCMGFLDKVRAAYQRAQTLGTLRAGLSVDALALDSVSFTSGVFHNWLSSQPGDELRERVPEMIRAHIALRRA